MILYDAQSWRSFIKLKGSVFPKALSYALPSALVALVLKVLQTLGYLDPESWSVMTDGSVYGGFTFAVSFTLVFRTSQSYSRYWTSATGVHQMRSEWFDACASLVAFVKVSKKPERERLIFEHTLVRLFSLLHGLALEELADLQDENFPVLDIGGLAVEDLMAIHTPENDGKKVEFVFQWIKLYIIKALDSGLLSTPPPIVTRVFQELGLGLVHFHDVMQVVMWPFPFPYAQLSVLLIFVHMILTPLVIVQWTTRWWWSFILTLISVVCMKAIDCIAIELEMPFGEDPNDLPVEQLHDAMNKSLLLLLNPNSWKPPRIADSACLDYNELQSNFDKLSISLNAYTSKHHPIAEGGFTETEDKFDSKRQVAISMEPKASGSAKQPDEFLGQSAGVAAAPSSPAAPREEGLQELLRAFQDSIRTQRQHDLSQMLSQQEAAHSRYLQSFQEALRAVARLSGGGLALSRSPYGGVAPPQAATSFFRCSDVRKA
eukprot:TRINITY_DN6836_c0_g1_i2.p1 TRINITY_DN6836_c0_g1~~TRINITY_DN6836_c0_g1_i2.p1  ORF type:complete len:488 (+),score=77.35 TRINITY_DN6836_c0_g1_i2:99-1562(+)